MSSVIELYEHNQKAYDALLDMLAKNEYLAWLEHKEDRYTTVYGYMD